MYSEEVFTFDIFVTKCLHGDIKDGLLYFQRHCEYDCINNQYIMIYNKKKHFFVFYIHFFLKRKYEKRKMAIKILKNN